MASMVELMAFLLALKSRGWSGALRAFVLAYNCPGGLVSGNGGWRETVASGVAVALAGWSPYFVNGYNMPMVCWV